MPAVGFQDADHFDAGFAIGRGVQMAWQLPQATDWSIGGSFDYLFWDLDGPGGGDVDYPRVPARSGRELQHSRRFARSRLTPASPSTSSKATWTKTIPSGSFSGRTSISTDGGSTRSSA
jgi:hypothetical protein